MNKGIFNVVVIDLASKRVSNMKKPFEILRSKMSPEAQQRVKEKTAQLFQEIENKELLEIAESRIKEKDQAIRVKIEDL